MNQLEAKTAHIPAYIYMKRMSGTIFEGINFVMPKTGWQLSNCIRECTVRERLRCRPIALFNHRNIFIICEVCRGQTKSHQVVIGCCRQWKQSNYQKRLYCFQKISTNFHDLSRYVILFSDNEYYFILYENSVFKKLYI